MVLVGYATREILAVKFVKTLINKGLEQNLTEFLPQMAGCLSGTGNHCVTVVRPDCNRNRLSEDA